MGRRGLEVFFGVAAGAFAAVTVSTVPFTDLGVWAAGVLGPLVVIGALVCVHSWPPRFAADAAPGEEPRTPWRLVYVVPLLVTGVVASMIIRQRPAGLAPAAGLALFVLLAYTALLGGVVVFLVVLLPLAQLAKTVALRAQGRPVSPYLPLGALLILSIVAVATAGSIALDGLPDGGLGLVFLIVALVGVRPDSVVVTSAGWWLAARLAALVLLGAVVALGVVGRRSSGSSNADDPDD